MRTNKQLLELLRDEIENKTGRWYWSGCMCLLLEEMAVSEIINTFELRCINTYLSLNKPQDKYMDEVWFERGFRKPRIEWLNNEINKL